MIVLVTDFGERGPYIGQMKAVLAQHAPGQTVIDLFNDAPQFDPLASAYLLAAYVEEFPEGTVFLCVVDPGVGSVDRKPVMLEVDGRWFVGPDNGLFEVLAHRGDNQRWYEISWRPERLSASFHGRDLFAPVAAALACGYIPECVPLQDRPPFTGLEDLAQVIYIDCFGNLMTGIRASQLAADARVLAGGHVFPRARTFSDVPPGQGFWYANANGLVEIAVNQGQANRQFGLELGNPVIIQS